MRVLLFFSLLFAAVVDVVVVLLALREWEKGQRY